MKKKILNMLLIIIALSIDVVMGSGRLPVWTVIICGSMFLYDVASPFIRKS